MKFWIFIFVCVFSFLGVWSLAFAEGCTLEVPIVGPIGSGTVDVITRAQAKAESEGCESSLLLINTPGGSLESTRMIVEKILNSPKPILCLVYPDGGHAGSAGAIILQACHVNGAMKNTNLGAATPIMGTGQDIDGDLRKKMINDTTSWMDSLTTLRGRDAKFGRDIVTDAKAVSAEEAKKIGAIDLLVQSKSEFLEKAKNREVSMTGGDKARVQTGDLVSFALDVRYQILSLLSDPQIAYLLFLGSLALLYFEFTHPGTLVAGVIGGLGLVLSLVALHKLNVEWGGLVLILLGIALLIAEMFIPSFGALGLGGIAAFIVGSIFLFDPAKTGGYTLPISTILITAAIFASLFLGIGYLVLQTLKLRKERGASEFLGQVAKVVSDQYVEIQGELWKFESSDAVKIGDLVEVTKTDGLNLVVKLKSDSKNELKGES